MRRAKREALLVNRAMEVKIIRAIASRIKSTISSLARWVARYKIKKAKDTKGTVAGFSMSTRRASFCLQDKCSS